MPRIGEAIGRWRSGELSRVEAAEVLGTSGRHAPGTAGPRQPCRASRAQLAMSAPAAEGRR